MSFARIIPLFSLIVLLGGTPLLATHIVGGELNYTCLGNNQYEINLVLYRDCFFGNPNAQFDDPASIGVFGIDNQLIQEILIPFMADDTLSPVLTDACLVIPPSVCVHTTTYTATITLPPVIGGYILAYQRCCRNQTILNIVDPLATGATYLVEISEQALLGCNSSPKFQTWPPLYICAGKPILFDQSATDVDGDSIYYRLCTPLTGADPDFPRPQPPNNPPYAEITWKDPPYNVDNMLNGFSGDPPLAINPITGLLTGTPNTVGQFVVGICVEEYRNGQLIGTLRRDFQYNVGICSAATAAFFTPEVQCGDLSVSFLNQSESSDSYLWLFGDPAQPTATSTAVNPTHTYSDTGSYTVTLIVEAGEICADTFQRTIQLLPESLFVGFMVDTLYCGDSLTLNLASTATDTLGTIQEWKWTINGTEELFGPTQQINVNTAGQASVLLAVTSSSGCVAETARLFAVDLLDIPLLPDSLYSCPGDTLFLYPNYNPLYTYSWSPATGLSSTTSPNPLADPDGPTTYTVRIADPASSCFSERQVTVIPTELPNLVVPDSVTTCATEITLTANSTDAIQYYWSENSNFSPILTQNSTVTINPQNENQYFILVRNAGGCVRIDSVAVAGRAVNVLPTSDPLVCLGNAVGVVLLNTDPIDMLTYVWSPQTAILAQTNNGIIVRPTAAGLYPYAVTVTNQFGCTYQDTLEVAVFDTLGLPLATDYVQCTGYTVDFSSTDANSIYYRWLFYVPNGPTTIQTGSTPSYTYPGPGTYGVQVTTTQSLTCVDTLELLVTVGEPTLVPDFTYRLDDCSDTTATLSFFDATTTAAGTTTSISWIINGVAVDDAVPMLPVAAGETVTATLLVTTSDGCTDSLTQEIMPSFIEPFLPPQRIDCGGEGVFLNPDGPTAYTYAWSPANGLDDATADNPFATPATNQVYTVTITDPTGGCVVVREVAVAVAPPIVYSLSDEVTTCGDPLSLTVIGPGSQLYVWATDPLVQDVVAVGSEFSPAAPYAPVYYVQISTPDGCSVLDSVLVEDQSVLVSYDLAQTICIGDSTTLRVTGVAIEELTFSWSPAAGILAGGDGAAPLVSPQSNTTYTFTATNAAGCSATGSVAITIFDFVPPLSVVPATDTILGGESVVLMATQNTGYQYMWQPPESLDATDGATVTAMPTVTTTYTVRIRDANGCVNAREIPIIVLTTECREPYVYLPNAFSPNGDNRNDVLRVEGNFLEEVYLAIYDRWGELVYESAALDTGWDGRYQNRDLPADVYAYVLRVRCVGGASWQRQGNVTLVR